MTDEFPILLVTQEAYEASSNETLGSKYKVLDIFNRINRSRISPEASNFAQKILEINKHRLLTLRETLP
jgi:hypothetical protein